MNLSFEQQQIISKEECLGQIYFLLYEAQIYGMADPDPESLAYWTAAKKLAIEDIIGNRIDSDIRKFEENKIALKHILSLITAMAILISKQFDACLKGTISNNWDLFDKCFDNKPHDRYIFALDIFRKLRSAWEEGFLQIDEPIVREITQGDKKNYLEDVGEIPRRYLHPDEICIRKQNYDRHIRVHLSIDPFAPIESIAKMVKNIIKEKKEKYINEIEKSLIEQGIADKEQLENTIKAEILAFDNPRYSDQDKRTQSTLSARIRSLRFYYYRKICNLPEERVFEILKQKKWWLIGDSYNERRKAIDYAERMITAALKGAPIQTEKFQ